MSTPPAPPNWPHCRHGADPALDAIGCRGARVPGHRACLVHLADDDRAAYLAGLAPGADVDHRGTLFTERLLSALTHALEDPDTGRPHFGSAQFDEAEFPEGAYFHEARFSGEATFNEARFEGSAGFGKATFSSTVQFFRAQFGGSARFVETRFSGDAHFREAQFAGIAQFDEARFAGDAGFRAAQFSELAWFDAARYAGLAVFDEATFSAHTDFSRVEFGGTARFEEAQFTGGVHLTDTRFLDDAWFTWSRFTGDAWFRRTRFTGDAWFSRAQFSGGAWFDGTQFAGDVWFLTTRFDGAPVLGPLTSGKRVTLSGSVFAQPVTVEVAAPHVRCDRTRWESTATVRLRYADVDLAHAVLSAPVAVVAHPVPFTVGDAELDETLPAGTGPEPRGPEKVRVVSVQGVDAAHLVLTATDLTDCRFSGAFHLDQIRMEGRTAFATAPPGWHRRGLLPVRFTRRRVLAEEHHWRACGTGRPLPADVAGAAPDAGAWRLGPHHPDPARTPGPEDVAALYRQLRKAFEDGKNEPGAADFYYGECEMRRHDRVGTTGGERRLLWAYWLLSGYGLRASRAFGWLLTAMTLTVLLLMGFGLPTHDPDPATTGTVDGSGISLRTTTPDPALDGGWARRVTWARAEKGARVVVNSVVFRSSGQNLTTAGTYIEMTSRLLEPTLLALGVLAVRGRIKR